METSSTILIVKQYIASCMAFKYLLCNCNDSIVYFLPDMLSPKNSQNNNLIKSIATTTLLRDRNTLVSWLFLVGSLIFLADGFLEISEGISIHALLHLTARVLFTVASVFIPREN